MTIPPINNSTSTPSAAPLTLANGMRVETAEQRQVYESALEFERFFVQEMLKPMKTSASLLGEEEQAAGMSGYQDMAQDQLTQSILDGGGLGIAATLYQQLADSAGVTSEATE